MLYFRRDGFVHLHKTLLRGFVVVRSDQQKGVRTQAASVLRQLDGVSGVVATRARDDGDPARSLIDDRFDDLDVFLIRQGAAFTGGAGGDQSVNAVFDLKINQTTKCVKVNFPVLHRGDDGLRVL